MPVIVGAAALVAVAISLGLMPGLMPLSATLGVEALLVLVIAMTVAWRLLRANASLVSAAEVVVRRSAREEAPRRVRLDTALFFVGAATVVEVGWRFKGPDVSDVCFVASFGWCCLSVLRGRRHIERVPTLLIVGVCLFAIGGTVSAIGSVTPSRSIFETGRGIWVMLLWPWTAAMVLRNRRDLLIAMILWTLSGGIDALSALGQQTGLSTIAGPIGGGHRATGFAGQPNDLGSATGALLVPALALAVKFRARLPGARVLQWAVVGLVATSLVLSGSVTGIAGALLGLILWMASPNVRGATRTAVVLGLVGALVFSSIVGGSVPSPVHRVQEAFAAPGSAPNAGSVTGHLGTITSAWPRIRSDPIIGTGLTNGSLIVHSGLVATWLGGGIFALVGILLVFGAFVSNGWSAAMAAANDADRALTWALVCAVVAFFVYLAGQPQFFQQYGFFAGALLVAWGCRVADERAAASRSARPRAVSPALVSAATH